MCVCVNCVCVYCVCVLCVWTPECYLEGEGCNVVAGLDRIRPERFAQVGLSVGLLVGWLVWVCPSLRVCSAGDSAPGGRPCGWCGRASEPGQHWRAGGLCLVAQPTLYPWAEGSGGCAWAVAGERGARMLHTTAHNSTLPITDHTPHPLRCCCCGCPPPQACAICQQADGAVVTCQQANCTLCFHVLCARNCGLYLSESGWMPLPWAVLVLSFLWPPASLGTHPPSPTPATTADGSCPLPSPPPLPPLSLPAAIRPDLSKKAGTLAYRIYCALHSEAQRERDEKAWEARQAQVWGGGGAGVCGGCQATHPASPSCTLAASLQLAHTQSAAVVLPQLPAGCCGRRQRPGLGAGQGCQQRRRRR